MQRLSKAVSVNHVGKRPCTSKQMVHSASTWKNLGKDLGDPGKILARDLGDPDPKKILARNLGDCGKILLRDLGDPE